MPIPKLLLGATPTVILAMFLFLVRGLSHAEAAEPPGSHAMAGDAKLTPAMPSHFLLNPEQGRPPDYPSQIAIKELQTFLKTQQAVGQGCGVMTWEGTLCGMFCNLYSATDTPWLKEQVAFEVCYAQTKTGTFIASLRLGTNSYQRENRSSDTLTWARDYAPEAERNRAAGILFGGTSEKRKELLARIQDSFEDLDLRAFPSEARQVLIQQLKRCETDPDPTVVALAEELRRALTFPGEADSDGR